MPQVVFVTESNLEGVGFPLEAELEPRAPGGVTPAPSAVADRAARIVAVAREIINETGDFDLPMRTLATRAQVSLRTPYQLFASKSGVIGAVLLADQQAFRQETLQLRSTDELENLIDRVEIGIKFFSRNQPFYRALYRATQAYTPGHTEEPAREVSRSFQILSRRASQAGLLRSEIDPVMMGETLTDIFASNVQTWARDSFDINLVYLRIGFGFAIVLAGAATEPAAKRMRRRIVEFQKALKRAGQSGAPSEGIPKSRLAAPGRAAGSKKR
jgi:AcrR family transcriptional regulator